MTIKDVEERTGLSRSNIRFYEKEKLGSITKLMGFRIPHIINSAHINEF